MKIVVDMPGLDADGAREAVRALEDEGFTVVGVVDEDESPDYDDTREFRLIVPIGPS